MKTIKKIVAENNEKRELLNRENKEYYENFLMYVRATLFKDDRALEEVLLEMLDHLIIAQEEGKNAESVFGKNPKELADEVIQNLPPEPFKHLFMFGIELVTTLFACYAIVDGIIGLIRGKEKTLYLGNVIIVMLLLTGLLAIIIGLLMKFFKKESYEQSNSKWFYTLLIIVFIGGSIGIAQFVSNAPAIGRAIQLESYGMFSVGCVLALITFILKKIREQR